MLMEATINGLKILKLQGMIQALESQMKTPDTAALSFEERLGNLVDTELSIRENRKAQIRQKLAKLTHSPSDMY